MQRNQLLATMGVLLTLAIGGVVLSCQSGAGTNGVGDGPGMLYFYAEW